MSTQNTEKLQYAGREMAGDCDQCGMAVWIEPGDVRESVRHGMCMVVVAEERKP